MKAVTARPDVGLLLPCHVTVEEAGSDAIVRIVDATTMMGAAGIDVDPVIAELAADAGARLSRVATALAG